MKSITDTLNFLFQSSFIYCKKKVIFLHLKNVIKKGILIQKFHLFYHNSAKISTPLSSPNRSKFCLA